MRVHMRVRTRARVCVCECMQGGNKTIQFEEVGNFVIMQLSQLSSRVMYYLCVVTIANVRVPFASSSPRPLNFTEIRDYATCQRYKEKGPLVVVVVVVVRDHKELNGMNFKFN